MSVNMYVRASPLRRWYIVRVQIDAFESDIIIGNLLKRPLVFSVSATGWLRPVTPVLSRQPCRMLFVDGLRGTHIRFLAFFVIHHASLPLPRSDPPPTPPFALLFDRAAT